MSGAVVDAGERLALLDLHRDIVVANTCASLGWPVLPWRYIGGRKRPVITGWNNGAASTDPEQLEEWFGPTCAWQFRDCHPGVVTGPASGLLVSDLDVKNGVNGLASFRDLETEHGEPLAEGFEVVTPTGGLHRYLRYPEGRHVPTVANTALGIDVRAAVNGFVVAPGTLTEHGLYLAMPGELPDAPGWFLDWIDAQRPASFDDRDSGEGNPRSLSGWLDLARSFTPDRPCGHWETQRLFLVSVINAARARDVARDAAVDFVTEVAEALPQLRDDDPWTRDHVDQQLDYEYRVHPPGVRLRPPLPWRAARTLEVVPDNVVEFPSGVATTAAVTALEVREGERNTAFYNGKDFAEFARGRLVWTQQQGWLVWDETHWRSDERLENKRLVDEFTDSLSRRYAEADRDEQDLLHARIRSLESTNGRNGCLDFAAPYLARLLTEFDADPWLLNVGNGTLDLRTLKLKKKWDPADLLTRFIPTEYHADARDERWTAFIGTAVGDQARLEVFWRFIGSCLTGVAEDKRFLVLTGPTDTGKSTAIEPFVALLGDVAHGGYATVWDAQVVQRQGQVNRFEKLHKARAARLVVVGEMEKGSRFDDEFVKRTTGGDTLDARALYRDSYSYRPSFKLVTHSNYTPRSADRAVHNRLLPLPFTHRFEPKDPAVKAHLESEACRPALLAFAASGCAAWRRDRLGPTPWLADWLRQYELDSDPTLAFLEALGATATDDWREMVTTDGLWRAYQSWASEHVKRPMGRLLFEAAVRERGYEKRKVQGGEAKTAGRPTVWWGLRVGQAPTPPPL